MPIHLQGTVEASVVLENNVSSSSYFSMFNSCLRLKVNTKDNIFRCAMHTNSKKVPWIKFNWPITLKKIKYSCVYCSKCFTGCH